MNKVNNAIIMAAGLGSRLRPLTYETPKPLIEVKGIRIIDTIIDALYTNGIDNIYIIRGYKAQAFDVLLNKYPKLKMLNNLCYDQGNNILSATLAGTLLSNAFVLPADLYISNPKVFNPLQKRSNVLGYPVGETADWCIETDSTGKIIRLSPGGKNCFKDTGIFYWDSKDGIKLASIYECICQDKTNWERYWSSVPFGSHQQEFTSYIRICNQSDVIEIDSLDDLISIDDSYSKYLHNNGRID